MSTKASEREKRRAAALRANLKRRKQTTARSVFEAAASDSELGQSSQNRPWGGPNKAKKPQ